MELRAANDWTGLRESPCGTAKAHFWVTPAHLTEQAAEDLARFSKQFDVRLYASDRKAERPAPPGVTMHRDHLTRNDPLLDPNNIMTNHVVFVVSQNALTSKHGLPAVAAWLANDRGWTKRDALVWIKRNGYPKDCPFDISECIAITVIDEAQAVRNPSTYIAGALRELHAVSYILLTATPVPWLPSGLVGLLAFLEDPDINLDAEGLLRQKNPPNPYSRDAPEKLHQYRATTSMFSHFLTESLSLTQQAEILGMVFEQVMIRRTYNSTCVTHPSGDVHTLMNMLPNATPVRLTIKNKTRTQDIYDLKARKLMGELFIPPDANSGGSGRFNGAAIRNLALGCLCPLFLFATDIDQVEGNPNIQRYSDLHDRGNYKRYLRSLLSNIHQASTAEGHDILPGDDPVPKKTAGILNRFVLRSERLRTIFALIADWYAFDNQKTIIFCQNPQEQEILNCMLNLAGVKSKAHLSRYSSDDKKAMVDAFNRPIVPHDTIRSPEDEEDEVDVLCISMHQNTGLNLQHSCCRMIITGPTTNHAMWLQCCGRIVRVGQKHDCLIVELYDPNTFNATVASKNTRNAIAAMGATINASALLQLLGGVQPEDGEDNTDGGVISPQQLEGYVMINGAPMHRSAADFPKDHEYDTDMRKC